MVQNTSTLAYPESPISSKQDLIRVFLADHPVVRYGITVTIQREADMEIVGQSSGSASLMDEVRMLRPNVVILDIDLPAFSGIDFTRRITELDPDIAVIVFTACSREDAMLKALQAGAKGYILKSIEVDEISSAIRTVSGGEVYISPSMASKLVGKYLNQGRNGREIDTYDRLSSREREVLSLIAQGHNHHTIAEWLQVSPYTIQTYRQRIMRKLDLHNGTELLRYALSRGLVTLEA